MNNYETLNVISMGKEIESAYPMYGLYAYGEGALLEQIKENTFTGIPVLYIPGENGFHLFISPFSSRRGEDGWYRYSSPLLVLIY